jgi:hypothetical protein
MKEAYFAIVKILRQSHRHTDWLTKGYLMLVTTFGRVVTNSLSHFFLSRKCRFSTLCSSRHFTCCDKQFVTLFFICVVFPSYVGRDMSFLFTYTLFFPSVLWNLNLKKNKELEIIFVNLVVQEMVHVVQTIFFIFEKMPDHQRTEAHYITLSWS